MKLVGVVFIIVVVSMGINVVLDNQVKNAGISAAESVASKAVDAYEGSKTKESSDTDVAD